MPPPVKPRKKDKLDDPSDQEEELSAGRSIILLLGMVALAVVLLIARRTLYPSPTTMENLLVEQDEQKLGIRDDYPVGLLSDANGNASLAAPARNQDDEDNIEADQVMQLKEELAATHLELPKAQPASRSQRIPALGNFVFSDAQEYLDAPDIVLPPSATGEPFKSMWTLLPAHEKYFATHSHKRYVPRLAQAISRQEFHEVFRKTSTPVIIPFEYVRHMGFLTRAQTIEELRLRYPYVPPVSGKTIKTYNPNSGRKGVLDIGPAVYAISKDAKLEKIAVGVRNYPRNLQLSSRNLYAMDVSRPPFIDKRRFQAAAMWFGTSTSDTKFHHDCCDNFVMMVAGTKRWFLAPPTDWRTLMPIQCEGDHQSLCWASVPYPLRDLNAREHAILQQLNNVTIDLRAGEMLYLPAGWWHFILNLGPTVMLNHWTYGCENSGLVLDLDPSRADRLDFSRCESSAKVEAEWRRRMDEKLSKA